MEKAKTQKPQKEDVTIDVLLGVRPHFKEPRQEGRLPQLNKRSRRLKQHYRDLELGVI